MARIFITGSTDMRGAKQAQYQTQLKQILDNCIARGDTVITGDQPGIESIAQAYLNSKRYGRVQIKHLNKNPRKLANKDWECERLYTPPVAENGNPMHHLREGYHHHGFPVKYYEYTDEGFNFRDRNILHRVDGVCIFWNGDPEDRTMTTLNQAFHLRVPVGLSTKGEQFHKYKSIEDLQRQLAPDISDLDDAQEPTL